VTRDAHCRGLHAVAAAVGLDSSSNIHHTPAASTTTAADTSHFTISRNDLGCTRLRLLLQCCSSSSDSGESRNTLDSLILSLLALPPLTRIDITSHPLITSLPTMPSPFASYAAAALAAAGVLGRVDEFAPPCLCGYAVATCAPPGVDAEAQLLKVRFGGGGVGVGGGGGGSDDDNA